MSENKLIVFKPKRHGLFKDKDAPSLTLDLENKFFEYTFTKKQPKTKTELLMDLKFNRNPLHLQTTRVTVTMKLDDIAMVDYDEALDSVMIVGAFCVTYKNLTLDQEVVREYKEKNHCFALEDLFDDMKIFVDAINSFEKSEKLTTPPILISL